MKIMGIIGPPAAHGEGTGVGKSLQKGFLERTPAPRGPSTMRSSLFGAVILVLLSGCINVSDRVGKEFRPIASLADLDGLYENYAGRTGYLSAVLWQEDVLKKAGMAGHWLIDRIDVAATPESVVVSAISGGCVAYSQSYVAGKDIEISGGTIVVRRKVHLLTREPGDPLVGPSFETVVLGLDEDGHGKYRSSFRAGGLMFLLVPMGLSGTTEMRFERKPREPGGFPSCGERE